MFPHLKILKSKAVLALAATFLMAAPVLGNAQTTGAVSFRINQYGFIMGTTGGVGVLVFNGKEYPLQVDGISALMIGGARSVLAGSASNLRAAADIERSYTTVGVDAAWRGEEGP